MPRLAHLYITVALFFTAMAVVPGGLRAASMEDTVSAPLQKHIGGGYCKIIDSFSYGKVGAALATLAVLVLAFGSFFGRTNWMMTVIVSAAIAAMGGAAIIVDSFINDSSDGCTQIRASSSGGSSGGGSSGGYP